MSLPPVQPDQLCVGDAVGWVWSYGNGSRAAAVGTVTKVTATQLTATGRAEGGADVEVRFMRSTGRSTGNYMLREAHLTTVEEAEQVRAAAMVLQERRNMLRKVEAVQWRKFPDRVLRAVLFLVDAETGQSTVDASDPGR